MKQKIETLQTNKYRKIFVRSDCSCWQFYCESLNFAFVDRKAKTPIVMLHPAYRDILHKRFDFTPGEQLAYAEKIAKRLKPNWDQNVFYVEALREGTTIEIIDVKNRLENERFLIEQEDLNPGVRFHVRQDTRYIGYLESNLKRDEIIRTRPEYDQLMQDIAIYTGGVQDLGTSYISLFDIELLADVAAQCKATGNEVCLVKHRNAA